MSLLQHNQTTYLLSIHSFNSLSYAHTDINGHYISNHYILYLQHNSHFHKRHYKALRARDDERMAVFRAVRDAIRDELLPEIKQRR